MHNCWALHNVQEDTFWCECVCASSRYPFIESYTDFRNQKHFCLKQLHHCMFTSVSLTFFVNFSHLFLQSMIQKVFFYSFTWQKLLLYKGNSGKEGCPKSIKIHIKLEFTSTISMFLLKIDIIPSISHFTSYQWLSVSLNSSLDIPSLLSFLILTICLCLKPAFYWIDVIHYFISLLLNICF